MNFSFAGYAGQTKFTVKCSDWLDEGDNLRSDRAKDKGGETYQYLYTLEYKQDVFLKTLEPKLLPDSLREGAAGTFLLDLHVGIMDECGEKTLYPLQVKVSIYLDKTQLGAIQTCQHFHESTNSTLFQTPPPSPPSVQTNNF